MDSRIILIAFLLTVLCFETFTLSANKPTTTKVSTTGVVVDSQNFPVLTPRSVNGVYILVMKNHKSVYFVSNKANINKPNTIKFSGKLIDFNGMIAQHIVFPNPTGLKEKISSGLQSVMNGVQGYTGFSVGAFEYVNGVGAAKKIASGYLFLTRITRLMYYLSGYIDIVWTLVTALMLRALIDLGKLALAAGEELTEFSFDAVEDGLKTLLSSLKEKLTSDTLNSIASVIKNRITSIKVSLFDLKEDIELKDLISKMGNDEIEQLNKRLENLGITRVEINGQIKSVADLGKDDWLNYFDNIINRVKSEYVERILLSNYNDVIKNLFKDPVSDVIEDVLKRPKVTDALSYMADSKGFDKDFASELAKKIESDNQLKQDLWDTIAEKDRDKLINELSKKGVTLSDQEKNTIKQLFEQYHEGKISKKELIKNLKNILGDKYNKKIIKNIIDSSPNNIQELILSEIIGSNEYQDYLNALKGQNNDIGKIFSNAQEISAKTKANLIYKFYFYEVNPTIDINAVNAQQMVDILEELKDSLKRPETIDILKKWGLSDNDIKNLKNEIEDAIKKYRNLPPSKIIERPRGNRLYNLMVTLFKPFNYLSDLLKKIKSGFISIVEGGINKIADVLKKAGVKGNKRFFLSAMILLVLTNAVKNALYNWYITNSIETGYTHGYLAILDSNNPNEELILLAGTRFYSRVTDALMRHIPGFDTLFTFCSTKNVPLSWGRKIAQFVNDWIVNIPGTEDATQALLSVVPDRYTLIMGNGELVFDYPNKNITIDSNNNLIMSRGAPVLNGTLKEIYGVKLAYLYTSPVKVIGTNDYKITPNGYKDIVSALGKIAQGNESSLILGLNPAQAIYISKIYNNSNDVFQLPNIGFLGGVVSSGVVSLIGTMILSPGVGILGGIAMLAIMHFTKQWVIEVIGLGSTSKIALSPKERLSSSCINVVFSLLSAFNNNQSEETNAMNYEKAVNFCDKFGNDVGKVLSALGMKSVNYLPITLDWYHYGPTNNIYIPGHIHANLEISRNYNDKLALACALANGH